jgi:outer membrane receptor for ferrienterochelin and colicins
MTVATTLLLLTLGIALDAQQQQKVAVRVEARSDGQPIPDAKVTAAGIDRRTTKDGVVTFDVAPGMLHITISKPGFLDTQTEVDVAAGREPVLIVELPVQPVVEEETTVVASTRTGRRLEDEPVRVEVLGREEIEEKMLMTPGDIVMMLNEMGGMRVQATSPSIGAASVRVQGMKGRYTRFLSDGLPLFGQQVGGLGLLQIPPMDLAQVEVIKGAASALYGAGAMGGVVNLLSRRPAAEPVREMLVNRSTLGATDTVLFLSSPFGSRWGASLLGGGHWQTRDDIDDDGWADVAGYGRGIARPRLFWDGGGGRSAFLTAGVTYEDRDGGTMSGAVLPATGLPYQETLDTRRYDVGGSAHTLWKNRYVLAARAAAAWQRQDHRFGAILERDRHDTTFVEVTARGAAGPQTWVAGLAYERDAFDPRDVPRFAYTYDVPGVFVQDDIDLVRWLSLSVSGRGDIHSEYGTFFSPRIAALFKTTNGWTSRISAAQGFFASTPLTEETEAAGLSRLDVVRPLKAERGRTASVDITRTAGSGSYTVTLFASRVEDPVAVDRDNRYVLLNSNRASTNTGVELLATVRHGPFAATSTYTYVRSREESRGQMQESPLTPEHSAGLVGMWEPEGVGRVGIEVYYTGRQRLEENPYRDESQPYVIVGALVERRFGPWRLFLNAENLSNVRQTRWDPLVRPTQGADGRWTVDGWAPLDGRVFNGGLRLEF